MAKDILNACGHRNSERIEATKKLPSGICPACLFERIKGLEAALQGMVPFIEEDFPNGTGTNHGTCATDEYQQACDVIIQILKGK